MTSSFASDHENRYSARSHDEY